METRGYIREKISEFERKLQFIAECREIEMSKSFRERNNDVLFLLHKDEVLFSYCLTEFKTILQYIQ